MKGKSKKVIAVAIVAIMVMMAFLGVVSAATPTPYYVNTDESIQVAVDSANAGDTIIVRDGTYNENVEVNASHITIKSENGSGNCSVNALVNTSDVFVVSADYVNISGFTVTGATAGKPYYAAGIHLDNASYCNISDNVVINNRNGIFLYSSSNNTLTNNKFSNNDWIYLDLSSNNLIYNNYFNNTNNTYDDGNNTWNITKTEGTNIIGGAYLGGNYWSDYAGEDSDGDGLGDTMLPYNSSGNIIKGGDWLPLTMLALTPKPMITLSSDPDDDLLFYVTGEDGLFAYYYGFKSNDTMRLTHVIFEDTTGNVEVVLFNDDFLPVQWILTNMTVVVYRLGEEPFDPHSAFHVAVYGDHEDTATIDIYPSNLSTVIYELESETGQNFDNARAFLGKYNISTFDELVTIAQQSGPEQPRFIAAAIGFSTSAAALSLAKENVTLASAGDVRVLSVGIGIFKPVIQIAADALAHTIVRELDYGLGDPTGPVVDVLLCRGVAMYGICHYVFLRQGVVHCVSFCRTSLRCFTDICMPMEISAEEAGDFVGYFF